MPATTIPTVVTDDGVRLNLEVDGPADAELTLIFVHGFTLNLGNFREQRSSLAEEPYRRVFYDQRGFGRSDRGTTPPSLRLLAADLAAVIDAFDGPIVLIGHSMGGMTIQSLAGTRPDLFGTRVVGTVLVATLATNEDLDVFGIAGAARPFGAALLRSLQRVRPLLSLTGKAPFLAAGLLFHDRHTGLEARRAFAGMVETTSFEVMGDYLQAMYEFDEIDAMPTLGVVPTLVVAGETDHVTPLSGSLRIAHAVPGAKLVVAERAGHMVPFERPEVVDAAIRAIVARV